MQKKLSFLSVVKTHLLGLMREISELRNFGSVRFSSFIKRTFFRRVIPDKKQGKNPLFSDLESLCYISMGC